MFGVPTSVARADFGPTDHLRGPGSVESVGEWHQEMLVELFKVGPDRYDEDVARACWINVLNQIRRDPPK